MDDLVRHLARMLGPDATFREGQREAIEAVIEDGGRALVVQRTGWGKSLVYWIATRVRRDRGHGGGQVGGHTRFSAVRAR